MRTPALLVVTVLGLAGLPVAPADSTSTATTGNSPNPIEVEILSVTPQPGPVETLRVEGSYTPRWTAVDAAVLTPSTEGSLAARLEAVPAPQAQVNQAVPFVVQVMPLPALDLPSGSVVGSRVLKLQVWAHGELGVVGGYRQVYFGWFW